MVSVRDETEKYFQKHTKISKNNKNTLVDNKKHSQNIQALKILYTNADSLFNKKDELELRIQTENPDIVALTEVLPKNMKDYHDIELNIENFELHKPEKMRRGTCIYTKKSITACLHQLTEDEFEEGIWIKINLKGNDQLLLGCIYRSPNSTIDNNNRLIKLINTMNNIKISHKVLMGDFNFKNIEWDTMTANSVADEQTKQFINTINDTFLFQHVTEPTRYRINQQANILDLVFTNEENMVENIIYKEPLGNSDHVTLTVDLKCYSNPNSTNNQK